MFLDDADPAWDDWEDRTLGRIELERVILRLPTQQRIAVQKWLRDEALTNAESNALYHAKRNLRNALR